MVVETAALAKILAGQFAPNIAMEGLQQLGPKLDAVENKIKDVISHAFPKLRPKEVKIANNKVGMERPNKGDKTLARSRSEGEGNLDIHHRNSPKKQMDSDLLEIQAMAARNNPDLDKSHWRNKVSPLDRSPDDRNIDLKEDRAMPTTSQAAAPMKIMGKMTQMLAEAAQAPASVVDYHGMPKAA